MKKVCLLLLQLLLEMIYTIMERNVFLVRHARFLSHVSALFVLKLIMNVTAALLEMLFVIRVLTLILSFLSCHVNDIVGSARPGFQK